MRIDRGMQDKTSVSDVHFSDQSQEPQCHGANSSRRLEMLDRKHDAVSNYYPKVAHV